MLAKGDKAPAFTLKGDEGKDVSLSSLKGKKIVLYFYPKDDTPGCTVEATDFSERLKQFSNNGTYVLGVSPDSIESHIKFKKKFDLKFTLLSDPDNKVATLYSAYGEKKMYGKTYMGIIRSTFIIDENGVIDEAQYNVKATGHAERIVCKINPK